ncbi:Hypp4408 [Branchiostoma lanceolatum]|uniref:Hypp4408 protein n=1 Tax=Branchiostoma lanceolatum TaxID=7740 RepID=A0A8K0A7I3_BRALA|nr:Hypp4408 [Branchiostoma lanceolatum]
MATMMWDQANNCWLGQRKENGKISKSQCGMTQQVPTLSMRRASGPGWLESEWSLEQVVAGGGCHLSVTPGSQGTFEGQNPDRHPPNMQGGDENQLHGGVSSVLAVFLPPAPSEVHLFSLCSSTFLCKQVLPACGDLSLPADHRHHKHTNHTFSPSISCNYRQPDLQEEVE